MSQHLVTVISIVWSRNWISSTNLCFWLKFNSIVLNTQMEWTWTALDCCTNAAADHCNLDKKFWWIGLVVGQCVGLGLHFWSIQSHTEATYSIIYKLILSAQWQTDSITITMSGFYFGEQKIKSSIKSILPPKVSSRGSYRMYHRMQWLGFTWNTSTQPWLVLLQTPSRQLRAQTHHLTKKKCNCKTEVKTELFYL